MKRATPLAFALLVLVATFTATNASSDSDVDICSLIRANLSRHAFKQIASFEASEYVQSYVETLKMKEVLALWSEHNCGSASLSASLSPISSLKHLAEVARHSTEILVNNIHNDFTSLIEHVNSLAQKGLDATVNAFLSSTKASQSNEWSCVICGMLVKLAQNDAAYKKQNIANYVSNHFCKLFPSSLESTCEAFIKSIGPYLIEAQLKRHNADVICAKSGACSGIYT